MRIFKKLTLTLLLSFVMFGFSQCSSTKKLEQDAPAAIKEVQYEQWVAGVEGGGAGTNVFVTIQDTSIELDSIYFQGSATKLNLEREGSNTYIGRFTSSINRKKQDIVMSSDSIAEYGNKMPEKIPFELKEGECVISYKEGNKTKYCKIEKIKQRETVHYPQVRKN